jgi:hypothetical protein
MLDQNEGHATIRWQGVQQPLESVEAAGGSADRDHGERCALCAGQFTSGGRHGRQGRSSSRHFAILSPRLVSATYRRSRTIAVDKHTDGWARMTVDELL